MVLNMIWKCHQIAFAVKEKKQSMQELDSFIRIVEYHGAEDDSVLLLQSWAIHANQISLKN